MAKNIAVHKQYLKLCLKSLDLTFKMLTVETKYVSHRNIFVIFFRKRLNQLSPINYNSVFSIV